MSDAAPERKWELPLDGGRIVAILVGLLLGLGGGGAGGTWAASSGLGSEMRILSARVDALTDKIGQIGTGQGARLDRHEAELRVGAAAVVRLEARLEQVERRLAALEGKR